MRITGHRLIEMTTNATRDAIGGLAAAGQVASSGLRVSAPSEDPTAWLAAHRASARKAVDDGAGRAINHAKSRLTLTDAALTTIGSTVTRARELALNGSNDTFDAASRNDMAVELRELFRTALAAANTQNVDGEYVLGGSAGTTRPFDPTGAYLGDGEVRTIDTGDHQDHQMTVAGSELTAAGGGPTGVDVLGTISRLADALAANDVATIRSLVGDLDKAGDQVSLARSHGGSLSAAITDADAARTDRTYQETVAISDAIGADLPSAAGELTRAANALEAARAVATRIVAATSPNRY